MIHIKDLELLEVFKTNFGTVFQSDKQNCLYMDFDGKVSKFSFKALKDLKKTVDKIDWQYMLINTEQADIEIILQNDHCFILNSLQIAALKDLLHGTFAMFQLNHIIKDCLHRLVIN
ncbi:MAG: hypothetical protein JWN56_2169 [Sphingobacteriales bacterium]|nr:hypothetical protein [Sphingobacteriales bacterium]